MDGTRVLAVTTNPSLVIGLFFVARNWEVSSQPTLEDQQEPLDVDVVVLDLDDVDAARDQLAAVGDPPAVVVTARDAPNVPGKLRIASRPFTLDELAHHIDVLLDPSLDPEHEAAPEPEAAEADSADAVDLPPSPQAGARSSTDGTPETEQADPLATFMSSDPDAAPKSQAAASSRDDGGGSLGLGDEPAPGSDDGRPLAVRLFGRLARRDTQPAGGSEAPAPSMWTAAGGPPEASSRDTSPSAAGEPLFSSDREDRDEAFEDTPHADGGADAVQPGHDAAVTAEADADHGARGEAAAWISELAEDEEPVAATDEPVSDADSGEEPGVLDVTHHEGASKPSGLDHEAVQARRSSALPDPSRATSPTARSSARGTSSRWFSRRQRTVSREERDLRDRLARVLAAAGELEQLMEEVPLLRSRRKLAAALCGEIRDELDADTVGIWVDDIDERGWVVASNHGFTSHEARLIVADDQPLFSQVHASGGALLIDPVETVQAAVAGIGGAHTESFMAASVAIGPGRYGIITVGRNRQLTSGDLDTLCDLAQEAAPGLAVSAQLARFQESRPEPDRIQLIDQRPRSWTRWTTKGGAPVA